MKELVHESAARALRPALFLAILPAAAGGALTGEAPGFAAMGAAAALQLLAAKALLVRRALAAGVPTTAPRVLAFALAWPGMDAPAFLDRRREAPPPAAREWAEAAFKTALGAALVLVVAGRLPPAARLAAGWTAMAGFVLLVHCGAFHLASLSFRAAKVRARPIMDAPLRASSVSEFWGRRWNLAFRDMAHEIVFRPLAPRVGAEGAALAVFLFSGLLHEAVISIPARAAYGAPTAYFVLQGLGLLLERSASGRRLGLGRGGRGRGFALLLAGGPLFGLFGPDFVFRVALPLFGSLGVV